jgi:hypothetical protein
MAPLRRMRLMPALVSLAAALTLGLCAGAARAATPVTVTVDPFAPGAPVPERFLGLSFEVGALAQLGQYAHRGDLVTMLRSLGPGVLRFGGITADEDVAWSESGAAPAWASSAIGPAQLRAIGVLARRSDWKVLLTVGLAHYEPEAAAREVAAAHRALGPYLEAVEIGNEPDSYGSHGYRQVPWIAQGYEEQVSEYREAIDALSPGIPIAGPDVSGSGAFPEWGEEEALSQGPALLTGHHYPLGCAQTPPPSIEALLSPAIRGAEARSLSTYLTVARSSGGIPVRIDETNTVSCGGVAGISNTFASALWATAYITQAMAAGVAGINLEGAPASCLGYSPVCAPDPAALAQGSLQAQPEWYALLLTSSLVGERPLPTTISGEGAPNLVAACFAGPEHSYRTVLVDDEPPGTSPFALELNLGASTGPARVLRLSAPSPSATGEVLLGGRAVAGDGAWAGATQTESIANHGGTLSLELAPSSAVLVTAETAASAPRAHAKTRRRR